jgi:predicted Zn-dependent protease with MMP-like domain
MKNLRQNKHRSNRSNAYSKSKCSNWTAFDPFFGELAQIRQDHEPTTVLGLADDVKINIYVRPLHEDFIRPYHVADVEKTLRSVPIQFLKGIGRIILLGGTKKQNQTAMSQMFRYGAYCQLGWIALTAYPKKMMTLHYDGPMRPHHQQEYRRAFTKIYQEGDEWVVKFDEESLKRFYLQDTLIHEIGHHVDCCRRKHWRDVTEEFA